MSFSFGGTNTPKGAGDAGNTGSNPATPKNVFGFGQTQPTNPAAPSFGFGTAATANTGTPTFGAGFQAAASPAPAQGFSFGATAKTTSSTLSFGSTTPASQPTSTGFNLLASASPASNVATNPTTPTLSFGLGNTPNIAQTPQSTINTSTPSTLPGLNFGFGAKTSTVTPTPAPSFGFGTPAKTTAPTLAFSATPTGTPATSAAVSALPAFSATPVATCAATSLATPTTTVGGFTLGTGLGLNTSLAVSKPAVSSTATSTSSTGFAMPASSSTASTTPSVGFGITPSTTVTSNAVTTTVMSGSTAPVVSMNFSQLEENINKWTLELEDQEKVFMNQATQVNAWDQLLIENGDKIVMLNENVERIKQDQFALDHELDFIVSQQIELEDMIAPLERELSQISIRDPEREQSYQLAENLDTQLKQMAEDLKEIIEHLNESNKAQDVNDPIVQIGRILNAHMSSLQWIDSSTAQINAKLQQVERMQETLRSSTERAFHRTFD